MKKSFMAAFRGIFIIFRYERNAQIHIIIAILVTIAGLFFQVSSLKWIILIILYALVISAEMINTAIEKLTDIVEPNINPKVRDLKDVAAGAVLWISMMSVIIGIIIFAPEIIEYIY